ncbi:hypothetical protein A5780_04615 [Nocardia sp. 852002-20019_SCH5090214]|uniref:Uncharacterized protein n=1 Tax=Nocardia nova TaxID=37330 RepID=A0A2S6AFQ9_9NOCA|nr:MULTISPECIES: hypothetical protein [Nocardia]OBA42675.1 hypothetical protein A5780_04615 [Nocardia sp. 852002-20019_SCH5090214]PPJ33249.1 hypothetical protein C5F51_03025 [Nocardia nova]
MTNPVFHGPLANPISPERMHREIHAERHADCTPHTCEMLSGCRNILTTLGHDPDAATTAECAACSTGRTMKTSRSQDVSTPPSTLPTEWRERA